MTHFKKNGYFVKYHFATEYLVYQQKHLFTSILPQMQLIKKYITDIDYLQDVQSKIDHLSSFKTPFLFITKIGGITENDKTYTGGLAHLPNNLRQSDEIEKIPNLKKLYLQEMVRQNNLLENFIEKVIKNDPNSIIILLGDHGPSFYEIWEQRGDFNHYNISEEDYILDRYNVLAAIRWPHDIKSSQDVHFVPEIFPLVFAELSKNTMQKEYIKTLYDWDDIKHDISDWGLYK